MNLEDLVDQDGLQQDEWSLTAPSFGEEGQLTVIGWSGRIGSNKLYILKCRKCNQDSELFAGGYFKSQKTHLVKGQIPCGCAFNPKWSKDQYVTRCKRKATEIGYKFLGFVGEWKGANTKIRMLCGKHGEWRSGIITHLLHQGDGCPLCKAEISSSSNTKPDEVMIQSFFASGAFHPDTKFSRSSRENRLGYTPYWHVSCPECGETCDSHCGNLQRGSRPCACSKHRQQEAYINWLIDDNNTAIAIKFGIANNSAARIKQQDSKSIYTLKQHSIHQFPSVQQCKKAERECLQELECGVVLKCDMGDGYSETTYVYNLEKITEIFERNGGDPKITLDTTI